VCLEALLKVGGDAYITLRWDGKALEKIDIFHDSPPSPRLRGTPFTLERCCIPTYRGGKNGLPPEALVVPERRVVEPIGIEPTTS
jgi:hypothetical protein